LTTTIDSFISHLVGAAAGAGRHHELDRLGGLPGQRSAGRHRRGDDDRGERHPFEDRRRMQQQHTDSYACEPPWILNDTTRARQMESPRNAQILQAKCD
jgi:hypothetical protein